MKKVFYVAFGSLLVVIFLLFQGCGDTNLFEGMADDGGDAAEIEEVRQNLNSGSFDQVISSLGTKTDLSETEARYLASAYVGKAGFDTLTLLEEIAKNDDDDETNNVEAFDAISGIFGTSLTTLELGDKIDLIDDALLALGAPAAARARYLARSTSGSDDMRLQRGIYAAIRAILNISLAICNQCNITNTIPLTTTELKKVLEANNFNQNSPIPMFDAANMPQGLSRDLLLISDGVAALSGGSLVGQDLIDGKNKNDIQREFNKFLKSVGFLSKDPTDPNDPTDLAIPATWSVTGYELSTYLNHLLWPAIPGLPQ